MTDKPVSVDSRTGARLMFPTFLLRLTQNPYQETVSGYTWLLNSDNDSAAGVAGPGSIRLTGGAFNSDLVNARSKGISSHVDWRKIVTKGTNWQFPAKRYL